MWDDDGSAPAPINTIAPFSGRAATNTNSGFSVGKGRGFGNFSNVRDSLPTVGSNNYAACNETSDDAWDDGPSRGSGYQKNVTSSWGSSNKENGWQDGSDTRNNNSSSWGNKDNSWGGKKTNDTWSGNTDDQRGGGFGARKVPHKSFEEDYAGHSFSSNRRGDRNIPRKDRGSGCFKCGQDGHLSRDCPSSGGDKRGGGGRGCFNCGEDGHMSRDCPNKNSDDNRRSKGCFKCGEDGHMSRDCPNKNSDDNRQSRGCFKCGEDGHMSRDCPNKNSDDNRRSRGCYNCGEDGHMSRDCPTKNSDDSRGARYSSNPSSDGNQRGKGCFNCNEEGHISKDCPNPDKRLGPDGKPRPAPYIPPDFSSNEQEIFESVPTGINFSKYDSIPVDVSGTNPPQNIQHFEDARFCPTVSKNIKQSGYQTPTPVQKYAIPIILSKRDLMACAQTGSGKTAAFLLPMIQEMCVDPSLPNNSTMDLQEPLAVIVAPTRELAIQIYREAQKFAYGSIVRSEVIYGGTSVGHQSSRIKRGCHILVATPGRLLDFVEKGKVSFGKLRYLVLDEADRMLDMGFIPAVRQMVENPDMPPKGQRQTLMFSATFPEEIQKLAADYLDKYLFLTVGMVGAANTDVEQIIFQVDRYDKRQKLMDILIEAGSDRTLVFVEQKRTADFIASYTSQNDIPTTSIHGDREQKEREEALYDFRTGRMPVLVATAVAARGLDIKDVCHVINYDLPRTIDEYVHRIGRTGRVGNLGKATSFYDSQSDQPIARPLKQILIDAHQPIPDWLSEEANNAIGTDSNYAGRGNFGSRDVRNQGRSRGGGNRSDAWNDDFSGSNNSFPTNNDMSQPLCPDDTWD